MIINKVSSIKTISPSFLNFNKTRIPLHILPIILAIFGLLLISPAVYADDYPPCYDGSGTPNPVHYSPVPWPDDAGWIPYTHQQIPIKDKRDADPSNGGRAPQNYANVSSSCTDQDQPSVAWAYEVDASGPFAYETFYFRWKVEQIANRYATGPSPPGSALSIDPWKAAQWTVLMDMTGDGFYDFAVHIDGQSGIPTESIDVLRSIYNTSKSQTIEVDDVNVFELAHNPTAFIDCDILSPTYEYIYNFRSIFSPTTDWPNGSSETSWDYGTTRAVDITTYDPKCIEYNIDYQIPVAMMDASSVGGPAFTADTPFCMTFVTANSNVDPLQKDVVFDGTFTFGVDECIPCGDLITLSGGASIPQPTVDWVTAVGCGPTALTAQVRDAINPGCQDTLASVDFYYYYDENGNGIADDGGSWTFIGAATVDPDDPSNWTASWDSTILLNGQYLIGVRAEDDPPTSNVTWSYLTQAEVDVAYPGDYANNSPVPGVVYDTYINYCGLYAEVIKSVTPSFVSKGNTVQFSITVDNQTGGAITVDSISDVLPPNFTYDSDDLGSSTPPLDAPTTSPTLGDTGTVTWTYVPAVIIPAGFSSTLVFVADTDNVTTGTYTNVASANTSIGTLTSDPVDVGVGAPSLTISKTSDKTLVSPGETVEYTITYSNDSPVNVTNVVITDELPVGLTFVSATDGGSYDSATHTITWNIGSLASLEGPYTVTYQVTVDADASSQPQNDACINSSETTEACASRVVTVDTPLKLQKSASPVIVTPGGTFTFTLDYENTGSGLTGAQLTDILPADFTFDTGSTSGDCSFNNYDAGTRTVTWNLPASGTGILSAGATGTCVFTATVANPYSGSIPATNTATISATGTPSVSANAQVGVVQGACVTPDTYHMHSTTIDVGFDGTQKEANDTAPTSATDTIISSPQGTTVPVEFARFYQNPPLTSGGTLADPVSVTYWAKKTQGNPSVGIELFDYDPVIGTATSLGSASGSAGGTLKQYTVTFTPSGSVYEGHRLLWVFTVIGNGATIDFHYDSTTHDANSDICLEPTAVVMNKVVDNITAGEGDTLVYTIDFGNTSTTNVTGAQIIDTLPGGVTYVTATLNGVATAPASVSGQVYTFDVNTSDTGTTGQLTSGGQTGQLIITVTIDTPIIFDNNPLINVAELETDQTEPISDTAATNVTGAPILGIKKRVDDTLLKPGDTTTFYIDSINIGDTTQGAYTVVDYITGRSYLTFTSISDSGTLAEVIGDAIGNDDGACEADEDCTITWSLTNLASNDTKTVTYGLVVVDTIDPPISGGVPNGFTPENDTAEVTYGATTATSNTVTVTLYTNANINITKTHLPLLVSTGDTVEYTITVTNAGATDATDVQVTDPIPAYTSYDAGTLVYNGSPQTDISGDDNAYFDALNNRVVFEIGTLASGVTRTMSFSVTVDATLPDGTTTVTNTATASASNTSTKQATETFDVTATPDLSITKSAPAVIPYPLTTTNGNHVLQTVINVYNVQYIYAGDVIYLDGEVRTVTAVNPTANQITVDSQVSVASGRPVELMIKYRLVYTNNGDADATNVTITDVLDTTPQLNYISASPAPTTDPGFDTNGTVTWDIGTVAAGETRSILLWARPTTSGTYTNSATMSSDELPDENSNDPDTIVGGIELTKSTSTPSVTNTPTGTQATYTITLTNQVALGTTVDVTDNLPEGFTYNSTTGGATGCTLPEAQPSPDPSNPLWSGCTLTASGTLTITFIADIAPTVGVGTYQNPVSATSPTLSVLTFDELLTTAEDVTVNVANDLQVTKAVLSLSSPCTPPTCTVTYLITVTNVGTNNLNGVAVLDTLHANLTYLTDTPSQGTYVPYTTWTVGTVNAPSQVLHPPLVGVNYTCIQSHNSSDPLTEPGVGADWPLYWEVGGSLGVPWGTPVAYNAAGSATLQITASVDDFSTNIQNCASLTNPIDPPTVPGDSNPANNQGCGDITPTLVVLSEFRAYEENGRVVVEWSTSSEIDTAGFYLFRLDEATNDYIRINNMLLPSLLTSPQGGTYSLVDLGASPDSSSYTYVLVEIEGKGGENVYGPFTVLVGGDSALVTPYSSDNINRALLSKCTGDTCRGAQEAHSPAISAKEISVYVDHNGVTVFTNKQTGDQKQEYSGVKTSGDSFSNYTRKAHESADRLSRIEALNQERGETTKERAKRTGNMAKISIIDNDMYYLDCSQISSLFGISTEEAVNKISNNHLSLSNRGREVAYLPAEGNVGLFFYGEGIDSIYTKENVYWLKEGTGLQIDPITGEDPGTTEPDDGRHGRDETPDTTEPDDGWRDRDTASDVTGASGGRLLIASEGPAPVESGTFTETLHFEENMFVVPAITHDPESDYWFWEYIYSGYSPYDTATLSFEVHGIADTPDAATLTIYLQGFTNTSTDPDHHVVIKLNGNLDPIGEDMWDGTESRTLVLPIDQALLSEGVNTIEVKGLLDTGAPYSSFYVDSFDLTYVRLYKAIEDSIVCRGEDNQVVTVYGFTNPDILVLDITDPYIPRLIESTTIDGTAGNYRVSFTPSAPDTPYLALSSYAATTEFNAWADTPSNLADKQHKADYIVITPEEFLNAAQSLANYRQSKGLETMVVLVEDIMDEFNDGLSSPKAIRDFLTHAYQNWNKPPKYIVLAGEGTYDYKDNQGYGDNLIPTMMTDTPMALFASDNLYVDVNGDHVPDMALGRFPVLTSGEFQTILDKIITYENSLSNRIILSADNPDGGGNFPDDSDVVGALVPPSYILIKIYLSNYEIEYARQQLIQQINNGAFLLNYIGHAGLDRLAHEGMLRTSDLDSLTNWDRLPVITAMTCSMGQFSIPNYDSLSEALVLKGDGGAVAVWAPTGLSYNFLAKILDEEFFRATFENNEAVLGDTLLKAYQEYNARGGSAYLMDIYNLQGDPALKIR